MAAAADILVVGGHRATADPQLGSRVISVTLADLALPDTAFPHVSLATWLALLTVRLFNMIFDFDCRDDPARALTTGRG
jgi:hypothetical protein